MFVFSINIKTIVYVKRKKKRQEKKVMVMRRDSALYFTMLCYVLMSRTVPTAWIPVNNPGCPVSGGTAAAVAAIAVVGVDRHDRKSISAPRHSYQS